MVEDLEGAKCLSGQVWVFSSVFGVGVGCTYLWVYIFVLKVISEYTSVYELRFASSTSGVIFRDASLHLDTC